MAGRLPEPLRGGLTAAGVATGLLLLGTAGYYFGPDASEPSTPIRLPEPPRPEGLPDYVADPRAASERVNAIARRTRGDYRRLTMWEERWINGMTAGYGHELLWARARQLGIRPEGPPPRRSASLGNR